MRTAASTTATGAALLLLLACSSFAALASAADAASTAPTDSMREGETAEEPLLEVAAEERAGAEGLSGAAIMAAVNVVAEEKSNGTDFTPSTCAGGFLDQSAINIAACPAGRKEQTVVWDAYDDAYAAAPMALSDSYLAIPTTGCAFGCVPLKQNASAVERITTTLPWRGKCFTTAAAGETVVPTDAEGKLLTDADAVPLLSRIINRLDRTQGLPSGVNQTNATEIRAAPATVYVGTSSFDGQKAIIIDYYGEEDFGMFRDEMRHVGCGVWIGKTYLTGPPSALASSIEQVAGVKMNGMMATLLQSAMPPITPDAPLPLVLNFVVFQTAPGVTAE